MIRLFIAKKKNYNIRHYMRIPYSISYTTTGGTWAIRFTGDMIHRGVFTLDSGGEKIK